MVPGYEEVNINFKQYNWGGLRYNGGPAVITGSTNGWWFYAIGASTSWSGGMPGGSPAPGEKQTELWVKEKAKQVLHHFFDENQVLVSSH